MHRLEEVEVRLMAAGPPGSLWLASARLLMLIDTDGRRYDRQASSAS